MSFERNNSRNSMPKEQLDKLFLLAYELKQALEKNDVVKLKEIERQKSLLIMLLEYLILNINNPSLDISIMYFLEVFLGKAREKDVEVEEDKEEELTKEERERRHRLMVYEVYKVMNPNRLAGETSIENFINNVITRGIKTAMKYEGGNFAKFFDAKDLENLESHKHSFSQMLRDSGFKGGGRGMR